MPGMHVTASNGDSSSFSPRPTSSALTFSESDAEFERGLNSYDVPAVVEALRRYLASETQTSLSTGSTAKRQSAQLRSVFYERFNQILDRVFGIDAVSKQKYGGWLDYSAGLGVAPALGSAAAQAAKKRDEQRHERSLAGVATDEDDVNDLLTSLTTSGRAIVKLLGGSVRAEDGSVFQFLFKVPHPVEFKFALDMLPEQSKMAIVSGRGASLLFTQLLHKPLAKQRLDLRSPELLVSITELYLFYFLRHPSSSSHPSADATTSAASVSTSRTGPTTSAVSSLSAAAKIRQSSWRMYCKEGVSALTRGNPYNVLLLQYLRAFLPDSNRGVKSRFHGKLLKASNLFLHILIEFWLRQNLISFSDEPAGASTVSPGVFCSLPPSNQLVSPFASVYTSTSYMAPSDDLLSSLLLTIVYLLSDSFFPAPLAEESTGRSQGGTSGMVVGSGGVYLSRSVTMLRPPLYAFFRLVFSRAPIGLSPTAFLAITDVWLAYIQPWHCLSWIKSKEPVTADSESRTERETLTGYSPLWESYVLANYHFYTTLLGAFVERAKELDFSAGDERNLQIIERVMSVYNSDLLALLRQASLHLEKCQPFAMPYSFNRRARSGSFSSSSKTKPIAGDTLTATQAHVLTFYCKSLGIECTPVPLHDNFHRDAERLFDKLWTAAAASASTMMSVHSPAIFRASNTKTVDKVTAQVQRLSRMLRLIFEISDAYVASTAHARSSSAATGGGLESFAPSRNKDLPHLLSQEGVYQLQHGMRLCSTDMAQYVGDPMLSPICSYEVVWLVRLSYKVSTWLNAQFGFENPYHGKRFEDNLYVDPASPFVCFRFNFRFLASKVNLSYLGVFLLLLYVLYFW